MDRRRGREEKDDDVGDPWTAMISVWIETSNARIHGTWNKVQILHQSPTCMEDTRFKLDEPLGVFHVFSMCFTSLDRVRSLRPQGSQWSWRPDGAFSNATNEADGGPPRGPEGGGPC